MQHGPRSKRGRAMAQVIVITQLRLALWTVAEVLKASISALNIAPRLPFSHCPAPALSNHRLTPRYCDGNV